MGRAGRSVPVPRPPPTLFWPSGTPAGRPAAGRSLLGLLLKRREVTAEPPERTRCFTTAAQPGARGAPSPHPDRDARPGRSAPPLPRARPASPRSSGRPQGADPAERTAAAARTAREGGRTPAGRPVGTFQSQQVLLLGLVNVHGASLHPCGRADEPKRCRGRRRLGQERRGKPGRRARPR